MSSTINFPSSIIACSTLQATTVTSTGSVTVRSASSTAGSIAIGTGAVALTANGIAIGTNAKSGPSGNNIAIGTSALTNVNLSTGNVAIGTSALTTQTDGNYFFGPDGNVAIGYEALQTYNWQSSTAVGYQALKNLITQPWNTAVGYQALTNNVSGSGNTAVGGVAGSGITSGSSNTSVGFGSGPTGTAVGSVAVGSLALYLSSLSNNTAVGTSALSNLGSTGSNNTGVGNGALSGARGSSNTSIGYSAGSGVFNSDNVSVGANVMAMTDYVSSDITYTTPAATTITNNLITAPGASFTAAMAGGVVNGGTSNAISYITAVLSPTQLLISVNNGWVVGTNTIHYGWTNSGAIYSDNNATAQLTGSTTVTGIGTNFTPEMAGVGAGFGYGWIVWTDNQLNTSGHYARITGYVSPTQLTVTGASAPSTATFGKFIIYYPGSQNTAVGSAALQNNTTNKGTVAVGYNALNSNTLGYGNTAVGYKSLQSTVGRGNDNNTGVGYNSLAASTGSNNVGIGYNSLANSTSLVYNTGTASQAGTTITGFGTTFTADMVGSTFVFVNGVTALITGFTSATSLTASPSQNVYDVFVTQPLANFTIIYGGADNTAAGYLSGSGITTGGRNTTIGGNSALLLTTGFNNTCLGFNTGDTNLTTGSNNTCLGNGATPAAAGNSNEVVLGNAAVTFLRCQQAAISALSDRRDKTDIMPLTIGLDFVNQLKPVNFTWNMRSGEQVGNKDIGFIAQDLQEVQNEDNIVPGLVNDSNPDRIEAAYGKLLPIMVKSIQDLSAQVKSLSEEVANLQAQLVLK